MVIASMTAITNSTIQIGTLTHTHGGAMMQHMPLKVVIESTSATIPRVV